MANYLTTDTELTSIANAIRTKGGTSSSLTYPTGFVSAIDAIPTGGGGGGSVDGDVIFVDYDGTIVDAKTKTEINAMTSDSDLPANPSHTGLTAQGWNWTVAQLKAQLTAMPDQKVYVGQMYVTESGDTEIDVEMPEGRLSPIMTIAVNGTISVDWGDNTTPDIVTGTSVTSRKAVGPHNYSAPGSYTIKISVSTGQFSFYGSSTYFLLRKNNTSAENRVYANCIKRVRLGNGITSLSYAFYYCHSLSSITIPNSITTIGNSTFNECHSLSNITIPSGITTIDSNAFCDCYSLSNITIPNTVTSIGGSSFYACSSLSAITIPNTVASIGSNAFYSCYSLSNIVIPNTVTSIGSSAFYACFSLSSITIPNSVTSIGGSAFYSCYSLSSITIPNSVTSIGSDTFYSCYSLSNITIPDNVTSIGNTAFYYCRGAGEYHILSETAPTLGTNTFTSIPSDCVIYVPYSADHSILTAYQTATNWSEYASYMQEEPT